MLKFFALVLINVFIWSAPLLAEPAETENKNPYMWNVIEDKGETYIFAMDNSASSRQLPQYFWDIFYACDTVIMENAYALYTKSDGLDAELKAQADHEGKKVLFLEEGSREQFTEFMELKDRLDAFYKQINEVIKVKTMDELKEISKEKFNSFKETANDIKEYHKKFIDEKSNAWFLELEKYIKMPGKKLILLDKDHCINNFVESVIDKLKKKGYAVSDYKADDKKEKIDKTVFFYNFIKALDETNINDILVNPYLEDITGVYSNSLYEKIRASDLDELKNPLLEKLNYNSIILPIKIEVDETKMSYNVSLKIGEFIEFAYEKRRPYLILLFEFGFRDEVLEKLYAFLKDQNKEVQAYAENMLSKIIEDIDISFYFQKIKKEEILDKITEAKEFVDLGIYEWVRKGEFVSHTDSEIAVLPVRTIAGEEFILIPRKDDIPQISSSVMLYYSSVQNKWCILMDEVFYNLKGFDSLKKYLVWLTAYKKQRIINESLIYEKLNLLDKESIEFRVDLDNTALVSVLKNLTKQDLVNMEQEIVKFYTEDASVSLTDKMQFIGACSSFVNLKSLGENQEIISEILNKKKDLLIGMFLKVRENIVGYNILPIKDLADSFKLDKGNDLNRLLFNYLVQLYI